MISKFVAIVTLLNILVMFSIRLNASENEMNTVKIQTSRSNMKPWLNFNDGATRTTFNTAVHGQALYFTPDLNIKPGYIKNWKWIDKEKKFRLKIDPSMKFHDGRKVTAFDFEFALIKPFLTLLPTTNETIPLSSIKGIEKVKKGDKFRSGLIDGVKVIDSETVDVILTSGHTRFLYSLGSLLAALAPIDSFAEDYYTFKHVPIGCGPYKVVFSDPKSSMTRVEKIGNTKGPKFIEFHSNNNAWENKVDIALGGGVYQMKKFSEEKPGSYSMIQGTLPNSIQIIVFNYQTKAAQHEDFRKAVSFAIERWKNIPDFPNLSPTNQIIPNVSFGFQKPLSTNIHNVQLARKLFNSLPEEIKNTEHTLIAHGTPGTEPAGYYVMVQNSLKAIGMKVKLTLNEATRIADGDMKTTMVLFGRYVDSNPLTTFGFYAPGVSNETLKTNPAYEKLFKEAEKVESVDDLSNLIRQLSQEVKERAIVVPLHERHPIYYISRRIKNIGLSDNAWTLNVEDIEVKE